MRGACGGVHRERGEAPVFSDAMVNLYSHDVLRLAEFYESVGFRETFRMPKEGTPDHLEVRLQDFTLAISSVQAAIDHAVPMPVISSALFARFASRQDDSPAMKVVAALRNQFGGHAVTASGSDH